MTFDEWLDTEYPNRSDRQGKFRMSSVRELMAAAWQESARQEREACAKVCDIIRAHRPTTGAGGLIAEECAIEIRARSNP